MKLAPLNQLFEVTYGNKFDLNKMSVSDDGEVAFIGRTEKNNGVTAFVERVSGKEPYPAGCITVNLGGAILESYVQIYPFYTAQNIAVLKEKRKMSEVEKLFYCFAIKANRFRYGAFGREANRTLKTLEVPVEIPNKFLDIRINDLKETPILQRKVNLSDRKWEWFWYDELFDLSTEKFVAIGEAEEIPGEFPFISTGSENNGIACFTGIESARTYPAGCITVASSGNAGEAFYQEKPFKVTNMVIVLKPKIPINKYIGLFLATLIRKEKYRYSYGRKSGLDRMRESKMKLPVDEDGNPDWQFMGDYIKSLPYSAEV